MNFAVESLIELERWAAVPGFVGLYAVSSSGRVKRMRGGYRNAKSGRILKTGARTYPRVVLWKDGKKYTRQVHRLVLEAFVGERPEGHHCRHLNGNPRDNRLANLVWGTPRENQRDRRRHGTSNRGKHYNQGTRNGVAKLTRAKARQIRALRPSHSFAELGRMFGVSKTTVQAVVEGRTWRDE